MTANTPSVAVIGFGEAGSSLCIGWNRGGVRSFDIKQTNPDLKTAKCAEMQDRGVDAAEDMRAAVAEADLIFSTVTADQAFAAASSAAPWLKPGAFFFDLNSCAPSTKQKSAAVIEAAGGRYVDIAVMATITPHYHHTPMLICGDHSTDALAALQALDMAPKLVPGPVGRASTIKMVRSVLVKGIEALSAECFWAASKAGVVDEVAVSLDASQTDMGWKAQAHYNAERMTTHGIRRAAEMREVQKTLIDLGITPDMTRGTIDRQQQFGQLGISLVDLNSFGARFAAIEAAVETEKN
jgi:3-hydroxyisobutyrate dehydrogenase-like beta-hydroxyacid dehydrogenase